MRVPILSVDSIKAVNRDHDRLRLDLRAQAARLASMRNELQTTVNGCPAVTTTIIPARVGRTPGGPVTVTKLKYDGGLLVDERDVPVYSWVKTNSANPADEDGGELFISILEDEYGTWWFIGQDCTEQPAVITAATASADLIVTQTPQAVPGTELVAPAAGVYQYSLEAEISVTGILGNQTWDMDIGIYNLTKDIWQWSYDWIGAGDPLNNPRINLSAAFEASEANLADQYVLGAERVTTTGTVTVIATGTRHQMLGPIK